MRHDATPQMHSELALDGARQPAALGVGVAQLGEQRPRVQGNELVQHGSLRRTPTEVAQRLPGRAGLPFVQATGEHGPAL